jgi:serine/threonine-protein kinase haspin
MLATENAARTSPQVEKPAVLPVVASVADKVPVIIRDIAIDEPPVAKNELEASSSSRDSAAGPGLAQLLRLSSQTEALAFDSFVETFPFDDSLHHNLAQGAAFKKVGEASYSEVFGIGHVVLKIIPLIISPNQKVEEDEDGNWPSLSLAEDVVKEVLVTKAIGSVHAGFINLLRCAVVRRVIAAVDND